MKVLFLIDHAPNYRESFLRELGKHCQLTVLGHPCTHDGLLPPKERIGYSYYELGKTMGSKLRFNFQLEPFIRKVGPDIICVALNFRYPIRILTFILNKNYRQKWIWWGQVFGRNDNYLLRKLKLRLLKRSKINLVYSDAIANKIKTEDTKIEVYSFNNSQFSRDDFRKLPNIIHDKINILFVGRPQKRKRIDLLIQLVKRRDDITVRLVGPGMLEFFSEYRGCHNLELYPSASGGVLQDHFRWSNIVLNAGHVGLLVMNAAAHNRPIVIDSEVTHAPEVILAKESCQLFVDFTNDEEVDELLDIINSNHEILKTLGERNYKFALRKYTVEQMAKTHLLAFNVVLRGSGLS